MILPKSSISETVEEYDCNFLDASPDFIKNHCGDTDEPELEDEPVKQAVPEILFILPQESKRETKVLVSNVSNNKSI